MSNNHLEDWDTKTFRLAIELHDKYELLAKEENWDTQEECKLKPFRNLPIQNQRVMLRLADYIIKKFANCEGGEDGN